MKAMLMACGLLASVSAVPVSAANLLVNGDFEASSSTTTTPPGWTNIGHSDGVIAYSMFGTPAYDGAYFYDLGGYGDASGPIGDGIAQTVATNVGGMYQLSFGLNSENNTGMAQLTVSIGSSSWVFDLSSDGDTFLRPFATQTLNYVATGASTTISFIETGNDNGGHNDPMIDKVIFGTTSAVPEPASWALMLLGFGTLGAGLRTRARRAAVAFG